MVKLASGFSCFTGTDKLFCFSSSFFLKCMRMCVLVCVCMCMCLCMTIPTHESTHGGQKRASDSLGLELKQF